MGSARPVRVDRWKAGVKLRAPSYVVLGMLRIGLKSGYAIKRGADRSTKHFWPISLAQVYPELARLEETGLITGREDPQRGTREAGLRDH